MHNFPYTNFHEINLDWILSQVKAIPDTVKSAVYEYFKHNPKTQFADKTKIILAIDHPTLQDAITAAGYNGIVLLTPGSYTIHETVNIPYSTSIVGAGFGDVSIYCADDFIGEYALKYKPIRDHELSGMYVSGFRLFCNGKCSGIFVDGSDLTNANTMHVSFIDVRDSISVDFNMDNSANIQGLPASTVFENNMFWNGVRLKKAGDNVTFRNNYFEGSSCLYYDNVDMSGGVSSVINIFDNRFLTTGTAINIDTASMVEIANNNIEKKGGVANDVIRVYVASFVNINDNLFSTLNNSPILTMLNLTGCTNTDVTHNKFLYGTAGSGIVCEGCDYLVINNNGFSDNVTPPYQYHNCSRVDGVRVDITPIGDVESINSWYMLAAGYVHVSANFNSVPSGGFAIINYSPPEDVQVNAQVVRQGVSTMEPVTISTEGYVINNGDEAENITINTLYKYLYRI